MERIKMSLEEWEHERAERGTTLSGWRMSDGKIMRLDGEILTEEEWDKKIEEWKEKKVGAL